MVFVDEAVAAAAPEDRQREGRRVGRSRSAVREAPALPPPTASADPLARLARVMRTSSIL